MKIRNIISNIKNYCLGSENGKKIDDEKTRDQIVYHHGDDLNQECTNIVICVYPSIDVINEAIKLGSNFIISHESLFWNHGDHTDWLKDNQTFETKEHLLRKNHIVVWRCHDYIHSGIPVDGKYTDGIFYGFAQEMGWLKYAVGDKSYLANYVIPETTAEKLAKFLINRMNLRGTRIIGNPQAKVSHISIPFHVFGNANEDIVRMDEDKVDAYITMELVDFTLTEYVKDSAQIGRNKAIITIGHFNVEEQGMKYMPNWINAAIGEDIPTQFVQATDMYHFVVGSNN